MTWVNARFLGMVEIILVAALVTFLIVFFQSPKKVSRRSFDQSSEVNASTPPKEKVAVSLESILLKQLGSRSIHKRYPNKTRVVVAFLETSRLALAKESDCGPMIVLNRNDERSGMIYKVLTTQSSDVRNFLSVLSHKEYFTSKTVDEILSLVYSDIVLKGDSI